MKAKLEINEDVIKRAIMLAFKDMDASAVDFKFSDLRDATDRYSVGTRLTAEITVDIGTPTAL